MSVTILRPPAMLGAVEAMRLRDTFALLVEAGGDGVIVDLTGVQELSAAGLAAVTNFLAQGGRLGIPIRVLLPEAGSGAARVIDQADLRRFLAPTAMGNTVPCTHTEACEPVRGPRGSGWLVRRIEGLRRRRPARRDAEPRHFAAARGYAMEHGLRGRCADLPVRHTEARDPVLACG